MDFNYTYKISSQQYPRLVFDGITEDCSPAKWTHKKDHHHHTASFAFLSEFCLFLFFVFLFLASELFPPPFFFYALRIVKGLILGEFFRISNLPYCKKSKSSVNLLFGSNLEIWKSLSCLLNGIYKQY